MRPATIFYLYRVRLRARLAQELLAVAGIAVGVSLLFASQVVNTSLTGSVAQLANQLVGKARLQVEARDPHGFGEGLLAKVQSLPDVRAAVPVLERSVNVAGPRGAETVDLIGVDARFLGLESQLIGHINSTQITQQRGLALPAPVAARIGAKALVPVTVQVGARNVKTILAVVLQASDIGSGVASPVAIMPLREGQALTGMTGKVTRILVDPQPGKDQQVAAALMRLVAGRLNVRPANFDATIFQQAEGPAVESTELFSAISALVGFLFAFNAMLLTVPQRRNLITDLRLDGYTPFEIVEVMLFDVIALGIAGTLLGLALGDLLSRSLLRAQPGYLSLAFPVGSLRVINWSSVAVAFMGGLLAAILGVILPLRREIAGRSTGEYGARSPKLVNSAPILLVGGFACVGLTSLILIRGIHEVGEAILAFASLTVALLMTLPVAFTAAIGIVDRIQRPVMGVSSRIAIIELLSSTTRARSLAIAATGAIAVYGSVAIEGAHGNLSAGLTRAAADLSLGTDLWVTPSGRSTTLATTPFAGDYTNALAALPGVRSVNAYRGGFLDIGDRRVLVLGPPRTDNRLMPVDQVVQGNAMLARERLKNGDWLTVSRELAEAQHVHVGQWFTLPSPRPTSFRVAAITTNFGWSPGSIIMNAEDYRRAWGSSDLSAYHVILQPGVSIARGLSELRSAIRSRTALVVQSAAQHEQNEIAGQRQGLARLTAIAILVLLAAALAMAAAMGAMIWQRRPRLAGMKVDGFDQKELWGALLWESTLLLGIGCSIGAAFGLYGQLVLSHALESVTGFPVVFSVGLSVAAVSLLTVTAIALAIVALPGYLAVQISPALEN